VGRRFATIIEQLDFKPVGRPVQPRGGGGHAERERALVADGELHQHPWQCIGRNFLPTQRPPGAENPQHGERRKLGREQCEQHQHAAKRGLQHQ
jgi:hypothetical protein